MRLTLRTMLAYMDGLLDPEDAQDIAKKIEESEYATNLMHRIRDCMRRLRLAAPSLHERGPNLDPNTVAEYLDNTLADDRVPDFEKVCLESDMHLAEVAACHQVLAMVLGEPAEVDPESRQRMYRLPEVAAAEAVENSARAAAAAVVGDGQNLPPTHAEPPPIRQRPGVPEYLREPRQRPQRLVPVLVVVVMILALIAAVLFLNDYLGVTRQTAQAPADTSAPSAAESPAVSENPPEGPPVVAMPGDGTAPAASNAAMPPAGAAETPAASPYRPELPTAHGEPSAPEAVAGGADVTAPGAATPPPAPTIEATTPSSAPMPPPLTISSSIPAPPLSAGPTTVESPLPPPALATTPSLPLPGGETPAVPAVPAASETVAAVAVGRLMSERQILLTIDAASDAWVRFPSKAILHANDELIALPASRPEIALSNGVNLRLIGDTRVKLLQSGDAASGLTLKVLYGQVLFMPVTNPSVEMRIEAGAVVGTLKLSSPDAEAAINVEAVFVPGTDPETTAAEKTATIYGVRGGVAWQPADSATIVQIPPISRLDLQVSGAMAPQSEMLPTWITAERLSVRDEMAAPIVDEAISDNRSVETSLLELAEHRRTEVRWLAVRSLACLGSFQAAAASLDDPDMRPEWPDYIALLRRWLARSPQSATAIRTAFEKQYGDQAAMLFRMLCGYSKADIEAGQDKQLVDALENETLAVRLLAFWNLHELTGLGLYYSPEKPRAQRAAPVQRWRERLAAGDIRRADAGGERIAPPPEPPSEAPAP